jgi:hypothetical protein
VPWGMDNAFKITKECFCVFKCCSIEVHSCGNFAKNCCVNFAGLSFLLFGEQVFWYLKCTVCTHHTVNAIAIFLNLWKFHNCTKWYKQEFLFIFVTNSIKLMSHRISCWFHARYKNFQSFGWSNKPETKHPSVSSSLKLFSDEIPSKS